VDNGRLFLDNAPRGSQGLIATSCSVASARRPARETASVTGRTFSALLSALVVDRVMGIELAKRHERTILHAQSRTVIISFSE